MKSVLASIRTTITMLLPLSGRKAILLRGWPGYRTRPARSGYDPLDADFEEAQHERGFIAIFNYRKIPHLQSASTSS